MKETVLDVLMYLFETFVDSELEPEPDRNELRDELEHAGFGAREIDRALDWLDELNSVEVAPSDAPPTAAIRVYDRYEQSRLDPASRGYLLHLEQIGILAPPHRELAVDRLLALDTEEIDIEHIKVGGHDGPVQPTRPTSRRMPGWRTSCSPTIRPGCTSRPWQNPASRRDRRGARLTRREEREY